MKNKKESVLRDFYVLWSTQTISQLGSSMTTFALTLWLYEQTGSALSTAVLTICSYAPYVVMSIFAGALTDRYWCAIQWLQFQRLWCFCFIEQEIS